MAASLHMEQGDINVHARLSSYCRNKFKVWGLILLLGFLFAFAYLMTPFEGINCL